VTRLPSAEPRYATPRTRAKTVGRQVEAFAQALGAGRTFMPWQQSLVRLAGELVEVHVSDLPAAQQRAAARRASRGVLLVPAFREVGYTVPRQNGKTTVLQGVTQQRAVGEPWGGRQRVLYSAQTGADAAAKLKEDWHPEFRANAGALRVSNLLRSNGSEGIDWTNASLLRLMSDRPTSGHGKTLHLGLQDELFADEDDRRDAAMIPAASTIFDAQIWRTSTAGTTASTVWNTVVSRGRMAAERGDAWGMCWVEYSAELDDDPDDPLTWAKCMPGLGQTISVDTVRSARSSMSDSEFRRAYLNIPVGAAQDYVFSPGVWERGHGPVTRPPRLAPLGALALEVSRDRDYAWLIWAHPSADGLIDADVLIEGPGLAWVVDALVEVWETHRCPVRFASSGPVGPLAAEAGARGVPMMAVPSTDLAAACGGLFDAVTLTPPRLRHPPRPRLDDAATHLEKRRIAGSFMWDRLADVDPAPVLAVSLAMHAVVATRAPHAFTADAPGVY
jgi:hypothetical protein